MRKSFSAKTVWENVFSMIRSRAALECRKMSQTFNDERQKLHLWVCLFMYALDINHSFMVMSVRDFWILQNRLENCLGKRHARELSNPIAFSVGKRRVSSSTLEGSTLFRRAFDDEEKFPSSEAKINSLLSLRFSFFVTIVKWKEKVLSWNLELVFKTFATFSSFFSLSTSLSV